ncbi:hypothetical protein FE633_13420 [Streptomyces montanus]|uniref:Lipoprotein n=1 Tax=Streptomyces montanus TaxID=2580423 RepID=A0A5R9FT31_9ACTN|nr:hypothetical protein FE633_13420 [Streptomyces montanus]
MPHKTLRIAAPALLVLTLSACGGGGDDKPDADAKKSSPKATQAKPASGGELDTGESATGKVKEGDAEITYDITAQKVDIGSEAEAQKLVQDPADAKGMVLAVAHVQFTHKAGPALTESPDANDSTTIWADGQKGALLIGASDDSPGCEDPIDIESWKSGESHVLCESYLIPSKTKSVEVRWSEENGEPFIWKFPK